MRVAVIDVVVRDPHPVGIIDLRGLQRNGHQPHEIRRIELLDGIREVWVNVDGAARIRQAAAGLPEQANGNAGG